MYNDGLLLCTLHLTSRVLHSACAPPSGEGEYCFDGDVRVSVCLFVRAKRSWKR